MSEVLLLYFVSSFFQKGEHVDHLSFALIAHQLSLCLLSGFVSTKPQNFHSFHLFGSKLQLPSKKMRSGFFTILFQLVVCWFYLAAYALTCVFRLVGIAIYPCSSGNEMTVLLVHLLHRGSCGIDLEGGFVCVFYGFV